MDSIDTVQKVGTLVPASLIDLLKEIFPNECPKLTDSEREVWFKTGQASVVKYLEDAHIIAHTPEET